MSLGLSLKYRIAIVIFLLEVVMMTAVLWNTTQESLNASHKHQKENHDVILSLLSELSSTALLTEEFGDIQLYFEQIQTQPDIAKILLTDDDNHIVSSSRIEDIGELLPVLQDTNLLFWREKIINSEAGILGSLYLQFTNKELLLANNEIRKRGIIVASIGIAIILAVSLLVGFALTRRLERISKAAKLFAEGNSSIQSHIDGNDELGNLGRTFDNMVIDVGNKQKELEKHQNHLEDLVYQRTKTIRNQARIIDQIHDSVISTNLEGIITSWNLGAQRLFGYTSEEMIGQHIKNVYPEDQIEKLERLIKELKAIGEYETEVIMERKNKELFYALLSLSIQYDENNRKIGMIGYSADITDRKIAEEELRKRSHQLQVTNQELEAFSYSVSHDLRSPLRAINGFCSALMDDFQHKLDGESLDLLNRIKKNSIRMGRLIDDLLNLSRIGRQKISKSKTNLSHISTEIIQRLQDDEPHRNVNIKIEQELHAHCDENLIGIVLDNLLENAWKYTSKKDKANIEFGVKQIDNKNVFYIKDDGAGFDMAYSEKLFGAFQRLHKANEFKGTGIGLATVARILHRHYGRIWAEAETDKGATFYFELPDSDD